MKKLIVVGVLLSGIFIIAGCALYTTAPKPTWEAIVQDPDFQRLDTNTKYRVIERWYDETFGYSLPVRQEYFIKRQMAEEAGMGVSQISESIDTQYEYSEGEMALHNFYAEEILDSIDTQYEYYDPYLDNFIDQTTDYQQSSLYNNSSSSIGFVNHYDSQKGYQGFSTINPDSGTVLNYDSKRGYTGFSTFNRETGVVHHYDSNRGYTGMSTISILGD